MLLPLSVISMMMDDGMRSDPDAENKVREDKTLYPTTLTIPIEEISITKKIKSGKTF